jgi:hypothetical protein
MVDQWKSPDTDVFEANKVLVIGISPDKVTRKTFEEKLSSALEKKGVHAVRSIDFFEKSFTNAQKSEKELNSIEKQLMDAGFDAVLFSTVTGSENKVTALQSYQELSKTFLSFRDYYYSNQHLFHEEYDRTVYQIYHTETALYCICPGQERELLWKGYIDIVDPQKMERSVNEYVKVLVNGLEEKQLLVVK